LKPADSNCRFLVVLLTSFFVTESVSALTIQLQNSGNLLVMSNVNVTVQYDLTNGLAAFYWQNQEVISAFYSGIGFTSGQGYLEGVTYKTWSWTTVNSNEVMITANGNGHPTMKQYFTFDQSNSFLVQVEADGTNLSANWMGPVVVSSPGVVDIGSYGDDRALFVPFDNDDFVSYNAMSINSSDTGYEVAAFYDNVTRNGLVVGSVTHDTWKSGVYWNWNGVSNKLTQMNVFGGANSSTYTHDVMPHGSVFGNSITSPTVFVAFGPDWRTTMESFADENTRMVPKLTWTNGVPFGWNSWGVIQEGINYADATNASAFVKNNLQGGNFNNNGTVYINLDSYWDNLSDSQLQAFVNYCHANGQKAGIYWAPFVWWGSSANAASSTVEGSSYTYSQVLLKTAGGAYETNDGALAMDLTHPGTQQRINYYINEFTNWGFDCLKIDFLSHGALEGVHYDSNVTTGVEAFNEGMKYLFNQINGKMFISESIAPLFPYQYGHSRRIACDAYTSEISNTEYTLNSVSYGWWLDRLYCYNDPDIMVFQGLTTNENQSRLINAAITGIFLDGDSFTNAASQSAAAACLTNAAIDALARAGQTFMPVEGNTGTSASMVFTSQQGSASYLAVFNYSGNSSITNVDLSRAGISGVASAMDLWNGSLLPVTGTILTVSLNAKQARLFRLLNPSVLQSPQITSNRALSFKVSGNAGYSYIIQSTTNLVTWNPVATVSNITGSVQIVVTNAPLPAGGHFYRAGMLP
jgi:hypothetical protein